MPAPTGLQTGFAKMAVEHCEQKKAVGVYFGAHAVDLKNCSFMEESGVAALKGTSVNGYTVAIDVSAIVAIVLK